MKGIALYNLLLLFIIVSCSSPSKITTSWKNPSFVAPPPGKLIVYAKISQAVFRNEVEDEAVKVFKQNGYDAIPAYSNITDEELKNIDSLKAKARALNATSLITFRPLQSSTQVKSTAQVSAGVGIGGGYGGMYGGFVGVSAPLNSGVKTEEKLVLETNYYTEGSQGAAWLATLDINMNDGLNVATTKVTEMLIKKMKKDGVF